MGTTLPGFLQNVPTTPNFDTRSIISGLYLAKPYYAITSLTYYPAFKEATGPFSISQEDIIPTISTSATKTIVSDDFSCSAVDSSVLSVIEYDLEHQMSLIIIASGTFSPPAMMDFIILES